MRRAGLISWCVLSIAALASAGCDSGSQAEKTAGKATGQARSLAAPLYASCGTDKFAKPTARPLVRPGRPKGWLVVYTYPQRSPRPNPGETTTVTLVESAPRGEGPTSRGARVVDIAGRKVSLYERTKTTSYAARWQTSKARYAALADGSSSATLEKIISCLP